MIFSRTNKKHFGDESENAIEGNLSVDSREDVEN